MYHPRCQGVCMVGTEGVLSTAGELRTEWGERFLHMEMGGCYQKQGEWKLGGEDTSGYKNNKTQKRNYDQRASGVLCWETGDVLEWKWLPASNGTSPRARGPRSLAFRVGSQATFRGVGTQVGTVGSTWLRELFRGRGLAPRRA